MGYSGREWCRGFFVLAPMGDGNAGKARKRRSSPFGPRLDAPHVGARVSKWFANNAGVPQSGGTYYQGTVVSARRIPPGNKEVASETGVPWELCLKYWRVMYDDGDEEEVEEAELNGMLVLNQGVASAWGGAPPPKKKRRTGEGDDDAAPSDHASVLEAHLKAFVFDKLVEHFRSRSELVPNITSMNATGFCRNCIAKWYMQACKQHSIKCTYDEALAEVYGMPYSTWKDQFHSKPSKEELDQFGDPNRRAALHAQHPGDFKEVDGTVRHADLVAMRKSRGAEDAVECAVDSLPPAVFAARAAMAGAAEGAKGTPAARATGGRPALLSDVCCEDVGVCEAPAPAPRDNDAPAHEEKASPGPANAGATPLPAWAFPPCNLAIRLGILTVSDRAFAGVYEDQSGPAIEAAMHDFCRRLEAACATGVAPASTGAMSIAHVEKNLVPDDSPAIVRALKAYVQSRCDLIFTTGGTGLAPRDVTPEATRAVISREAPGLIEHAADASTDPNAAFSRAVAGVTESGTIIVNLPGRPAAVRTWLQKLMPLMPHVLGLVRSANR